VTRGGETPREKKKRDHLPFASSMTLPATEARTIGRTRSRCSRCESVDRAIRRVLDERRGIGGQSFYRSSLPISPDLRPAVAKIYARSVSQ
jgi:hypothetical protein